MWSKVVISIFVFSWIVFIVLLFVILFFVVLSKIKRKCVILEEVIFFFLKFVINLKDKMIFNGIDDKVIML